MVAASQTTTHRILICDSVSEICVRRLQQAGFDLHYEPGLPPERLLELVEDVDALVVRSATKVTAEVIARARKLKVIARAGTGVDNIDVAAATAAGVAVLNAASANTIAAVEHTFALLLALCRQIPRAQASLLAGKWERKAFQGVELYGKTLGLIGLGRIGREVAKRAQAFQMHVLAVDPLIELRVFVETGVRRCELDELLQQSDFVSVHAPVTGETKYLLGREQFRICKPGLRLVNAARGGIIDEAALLEALKSGRVAGAALDVFEQEPPRENPLLHLPNVVATPHLGASTAEAQDRVAEVIADCLQKYLLHGEAENLINPEVLKHRD
ncbi:MAG: hypothetical protein D6743_09315 [Calditrichaeota bacterium]|nr:MAG: hypothetical protein D6743_09315 [Calditrichota bacterium]